MSNTSEPVDYRPKVCKGEKGRLINIQDNPRNVEEVDYMRDFQNCMGGPAKAEEAIELFAKLNNGDNGQKIMADGFLSTLITTKKVTKRMLAAVFKIGTTRIKRSRDRKSKRTDHARLNGNQVRHTSAKYFASDFD